MRERMKGEEEARVQRNLIQKGIRTSGVDVPVGTTVSFSGDG